MTNARADVAPVENRKSRYVVILEPLPDPPRGTPAPVEIRLRQALKVLLRSFRLRAIDVQQQPETVDQPPKSLADEFNTDLLKACDVAEGKCR